MLILFRRAGESIHIGDNIEVSIVAVEGAKVKLAITAPTEIPILRSELINAQATNKDSVIEQTTPKEFLHMLGEVLPQKSGARTSAPIKSLIPSGLQHEKNSTTPPLKKGE